MSAIKARWDEIARRVRRAPVAITYKGKPQSAVIISEKALQELLDALEDAADLAVVEARKGEERIPYEEVRAGLRERGLL